MTDVTIRPIRSTDEQALAQILESLPGSFTDFGQEAVLADAKNHHGLVAVIDHQVIGFLIYVETYTELDILWTAIAPNYQRRGVGRALVRAMEAEINRQRIIVVKTGAPYSLPSQSGLRPFAFEVAIEFWQKMGYTIVATIDTYWQKDNGVVVMAKYLWLSE